MMSEDLGFLGFLFERDEIAQIRKKIASVGSEVSSVFCLSVFSKTFAIQTRGQTNTSLMT